MKRFVFLYFLFFFFSNHSIANALLYKNILESHQALIREKLPDINTTPPSMDDIDAALKILMNTDLYEKVIALRRADDQILILAAPIKSITKITFTGSSFNRRDLLQKINLSVGARFDRKKVIESGELLKRYYNENGYFRSSIEINFVNKNQNEIHIEFIIKENEPCLIQTIVFNTNNKKLARKLMFITNDFFKKPFTTSSLSEIENTVNLYLRENKFLKAQLQQDQIVYNRTKTRSILTYTLKEPFQYELIIDRRYDSDSRIKTIKDYQIRQAANLTQFKSSISTPSKTIVNEVKKLFLKEGFHHAKVTHFNQELKKSFRRQIRLKIKPGFRVRLKEIKITGHFSKNTRFYADFIQENSGNLIANGYYFRNDLVKGFENLQAKLQNEGYLRAKVLSSRTNFNKKKDEAIVTVTLEEGPLTQIRRLQFEDIKAFSDFELKKSLDMEINTPLNQKKLIESIQKLKTFYMERGYLEMKLLNEDSSLIKYNSTGTQADIRYHVFEGPKVIVSSILIKGNSFTKDYVILNSLDFDIGDVLTPQNMANSETNLNQLGIFGQVSIGAVESNSNVSRRTITVSITEKDPGLFRFGAGVNTRRALTLRSFTGISYNNLKGTARKVSARLELSYPEKDQYLEKKFITSYEEPFLFNTSMKGRFNYIKSDRIFDFTTENAFKDNEKNSPVVKSDRIDLLLEKDFSKHFRLTWTLWSWDVSRDTSVPEREPTVNFTRRQIGGLGPFFDLDYRDNPFLPTKGWYFSWGAQYNSPELASSKTIRYWKSDATITHYIGIKRPNWVWANSLSGGYIRNLNHLPDSGIPNSRIFLLGGSNTVRGFGGRDTIPHKIPDEFEIKTSNDIVVDARTQYYMIKSELRFPIFSPLWGGVLFYDAAQVDVFKRGSGRIDFRQPYRHAVGVGLRINTPVGPISFDVGFKLRPINDNDPANADSLKLKEDKARFHLSFGTF